MIYLSIAILSTIFGFLIFKSIKGRKHFVKKRFKFTSLLACMFFLRWLNLRNLINIFYIPLPFLAKWGEKSNLKNYHCQGSKVKLHNIIKKQARELRSVEKNASQKETYTASCNHIKISHLNISGSKYTAEKLIATRNIIFKRKEAI